MALRGLSNPTLEIDNVAVSYVPDSLDVKDGLGNRTVRAQTAGGGTSENIITEDVSTRIGSVSFSLYTEGNNADLLQGWLRSSREGTGVGIRLSDPSGYTRSFRNMVITEEPNTPFGSDAEIEITFMGDAIGR